MYSWRTQPINNNSQSFDIDLIIHNSNSPFNLSQKITAIKWSEGNITINKTKYFRLRRYHAVWLLSECLLNALWVLLKWVWAKKMKINRTDAYTHILTSWASAGAKKSVLWMISLGFVQKQPVWHHEEAWSGGDPLGEHYGWWGGHLVRADQWGWCADQGEMIGLWAPLHSAY